MAEDDINVDFYHIPVLLQETLTQLNIDSQGTYIDCTMGGAGHSAAILEAGNPTCKLIALDQDEDAIAIGRQRLAVYGQRVNIVKSNFSHLADVLKELNVSNADGILFDIGVSSYQLDQADRGFSYMQDAPLDMRMDRNAHLNAADIVNTYSEDELTDILYRYGEENWSRRIAKFIVEERKNNPILTTGHLVDIIKKAMPVKAREKDQHPAKRSFQALRIAVNDELGVLEQGLKAGVDALKPGGRICVITFHSLEDRIVKDLFKYLALDCICPKEFPVCCCDKEAIVKILSRKPIIASEEELIANPRARSAKLRVAMKL